MKDAVHCNLDGVVVGIDWFWVERAAGGTQRLGGRQQRRDGLFRRTRSAVRPKTGRECLVAPAVGNATNDLFAAKFL